MLFRENKNISLRRINKVFLICMVLFTVLIMTGATQKRLNLPKYEKILWVGYWDSDDWEYELYCVITEKDSLRTLSIYKPTSKGYRRIYSYSTYNHLRSAYQSYDDEGLYLNWQTGSSNIFQLFEYDPKTLKIKKTFETAYRSSPETFRLDNNEEYLSNGDVDGFFWTDEGILSFQTAIFYKRISGNGYSKFTTCKWDDRYLMMDTLSRISVNNKPANKE